jgi:hypothetical protein
VWFAGMDDMLVIISKLESRIEKLESHVKVLEGKVNDAKQVALSVASVAQTAPAAPAVKPEEVNEDENVDLFGSDSEVCLMCNLMEFHAFTFKRKTYHIPLYNSHFLYLLYMMNIKKKCFKIWTGKIQAQNVNMRIKGKKYLARIILCSLLCSMCSLA